MLDAQFAAAFTAGMIATVNPCGFAMLPAYLGFFLGRDDGDEVRSTTANLVRALVVGGAVSAGFLVVFGIAGVLILETTLAIGEWAPWITIVIGAVLAVVGVAFIVGWEPTINLPHLDKGGKTRGLGSMFVFGVSYAIASLSCTIGVFTSLVASSFRRTSFASGVATFIAYALGMALILMVVTIALSLAKQGVVAKLRSALPYVTRISGVIMVVTGAYLTWYGIYEIRVVQHGDTDAAGGPVGMVTEWSSDVQNWLSGFDAVQVALVLGIVVCAAVLVALLRSPKGKATPTDAAD
ncbi:MAG: cytochrome c biogenesis protein CcdA [Acidimicrobiales bacterium]|nr:cytochrome c biogenesis protein CcdA [Acidimicrobiales bacterium]HRW36395.1 cytochrome c biogenesis CcdA family protein [Aquihabitans sp.]